jgi:hypothetical protein
VEDSRPAGIDDISRIAQLARCMRAELRAMKGGELWAERDARPEPLEDSYATLLGRDDAFLLVGTIDGSIIGFGAAVIERLRSGAALGVITDLFVEPEAFCERHDCVGVDAFALPGHRAAKNFFEESGFTARGIVMHRRRQGEGA